MNQLFQNIEGRGEGRDYGKKKFSSNIKYKIILIKTKKMDLARHGSDCDKQLLPTLLLGLLDQPEDRETEKVHALEHLRHLIKFLTLLLSFQSDTYCNEY